MGVPKLFKYLTERYPSLCQKIPVNKLPSYDYLYIDLNVLIHKAVNEKCGMPLEMVDDTFYTEERIFERVLRYIETLHRIVPTKVLFLAIDGVAPRAKWATQRDRRLRTSEKNNEMQTQFDKNAISPGTSYMNNFEAVLLEFVTNKIKFNTNWQTCEVIISGSSVPGEGSVKIIDFIRSLKHSKNCKPNETHCIYSSDNDYLLLCVATHELYVSFIQEKKRNLFSLSSLCEDDVKHVFLVTHFELLRQYLRMEFVECKSEMSFEFTMDSIVDDWVVLMILIGNDYLPGLPGFDLNADILTIIYDAYKEILKTSKGYLSERGLLNMRRFGRLLQILKPKDFDLYRENIQKMNKNLQMKMAAVNLNGNSTDSMDTENQVSYSDYLEMKDQYYADYFGSETLPNFDEMSINYVKTVQWILFYYFRGNYSWNHYYPFSCTPFVSDFKQVYNVSLSFELGKPVKPFTHLLAILPKDSAGLLPTNYHDLAVDDLDDVEELIQKAIIAEKHITPSDDKRNTTKPMLKLTYEMSTENVKINEIPLEKKLDQASIGKYLDRPLKRDNFNFMFSSLNQFNYSSQLMPGNLSKPYPRVAIKLKVDEVNDIDSFAEKFLKQPVYTNWPHCVEAKVMQIFNATKKFDGSGDDIKITENPDDFSTCVESLNSMYSEAGIDVGEIKMVAFVAPLKWSQYQPVDDKPEFELADRYDDEKWKPVAAQTLYLDHCTNRNLRHIPVKDAFRKPQVFIQGKQSQHYGSMATVADIQSLDVNGRIKILCHKMEEPNLEPAKKIHMDDRHNQLMEYKQPPTVATLLGIGEKVLAKITGNVLVNPPGSIDNIRKINIGLQLKYRNLFRSSITVRHDYVKSSGNIFIYSQKAIDLVQLYLNKFPRIFELLTTSEQNALSISDFEEDNNNQNGLEYLGEILEWLKTLPHFKEPIQPMEFKRLSDNAVNNVQESVDKVSENEQKDLKLKMKWQALFIPDLDNVFVIPCPDAAYMLLDRIVIVRNGYPFPIGAKGTVIGVEPKSSFIAGNSITDNELYALEILMDEPYYIPSKLYAFKKHQVFRTRSTNMLLNISNGRSN